VTAPPVVVSSPPVPDWDPGPRPPRWTAALTALLLVAAGTAFGLYRLTGLIGEHHPVRPDICPALDRGPLSGALGPVEVPKKSGAPGSLEDQGIPERRAGLSRAVCVFSVDGGDVTPRAMGALLVDWYDYAVTADLHYATAEGSSAQGISSKPFLTQVSGLGKRAFAGFDPDDHEEAGRRLRTFSVTAVDGNVLLNLHVTVFDAHPDMPWPDGQVDDAYAVLTTTARTALQRVL
jgi:hypothetical protein